MERLWSYESDFAGQCSCDLGRLFSACWPILRADLTDFDFHHASISCAASGHLESFARVRVFQQRVGSQRFAAKTMLRGKFWAESQLREWRRELRYPLHTTRSQCIKKVVPILNCIAGHPLRSPALCIVQSARIDKPAALPLDAKLAASLHAKSSRSLPAVNISGLPVIANHADVFNHRWGWI